MPLAVGLALALSSFGISATQASVITSVQPMPQAQTVQQYVENYFGDIPIMVDIAHCESRFRQYGSDGSVFRGEVNHEDIGVMQINEHYHLNTAQKMGLDIYTIQGNVAYARYLYDKEGTAPWASSQACWGKTQDAQNLALASTGQKAQ